MTRSALLSASMVSSGIRLSMFSRAGVRLTPVPVAGKLPLHLLRVVRVDVRIAYRDDEIADSEVGRVRDHVRQERVGSDVERKSEEQIAAALVHAAAQPSLGDVELEEQVTGRQRHRRNIGRVPGGDDQPPRGRVLANLLDDLG